MKKFLLSLVTILCVAFTAIGADNTFYTEWNDDNANGRDTITVYKGTSFEWEISTSIGKLCSDIFAGEGSYDDECYVNGSWNETISEFNFTNGDNKITITGTATNVGLCDILVFVDPYHHTFVINVENDPSIPTISYTVPEQSTICRGGDMTYYVVGSEEITSELTLVVGLESFTGTSKTLEYGTPDNQTQTVYVYEFDLSGMTPTSGTYTAEVMENGKTIATGSIILADTLETPEITSSDESFLLGLLYTFTANSESVVDEYLWVVTDAPGPNSYEFVGDSTSSSVSIIFRNEGYYMLTCQEYNNGCGPVFGTMQVYASEGLISDNCMSLYDYSGTERWEYYAQPTNLPVEVTKEGSKNDKVLYFNANAYERLTYALDLENDDDYATWMNILGSEDSRLVGRIYVESLGTDADGLALFLLSGDVSGGPSYHEKNAAFPITGLQTGQWFEFDIPLSTDNGWYYNTYSSTNEYKALWLSTYKGSEETLDAFKIYVDYLRICEKPFQVVAKSGKVSYDGSQVELKFTTPLSVPTSTSAITIKEGTETHTITSIQAKDGDQTVLIFNLETPISNASATITASLSQSTSAVKSIDGRPASEFNISVTNLLGMRTTTGWYDDFADASDFTTSEISADGTYFVAIENATQSQLDVTSYGDVTWAGSLKLSTINAGYVMDLENNPTMTFKIKGDKSATIKYRIDVTDFFENVFEGSFTNLNVTSNYTEVSYSLDNKNINLASIAEITFRFISQEGTAATDYTPTLYNGTLSFDYISVGNPIYLYDFTPSSVLTDTGIDENSSFTVTSSCDGYVFTVRDTVKAQYSSMAEAVALGKGYSVECSAGEPVTIDMSDLGYGYFTTYAYNSLTGAVSLPYGCYVKEPAVRVSFPQTEYHITIGDSVLVCLDITSEEPDFNLDDVSVSFEYIEADVQFIEAPTGTVGCTYIKALPGGSWAEVTATVTYNGEEYSASSEVFLEDAPFAWENCPEAPLSFEDGSYELQISRWFDVSSYSYNWSSNNEDVATVGADGTVTFVAPGSAEILCSATNLYDQSVVQAQCPLTIQKTQQETEFTISEKSTLSVCQGDAATVIITAEPAATFAVVSSDNETVYTAENQGSVSFALSATTTSTYYIVENGTQKEEFTITVNEKPTVTISATQSVVCVGDEVQLEAHMNLSDGSFFWGGADNFDDATSGNPKFVATYDGHYAIFCQVTGAGNCVGTAETSVMVYPTPTVTITGPAEAYVGDEVEYTATLAASNMPSTATFTYEWGGGVESFDTDTKAKGSFSESDIDNGAEVFCNVATTDGTCSATATYPVVVKAKTEYTISGETTFCAGSKDFITITSEEPINTESFSIETSYNETVPFTINADDPNVAIIYHASLPTGGYSINIMENRQIVNSFQVRQNIGPQRVSFNCPEEGEAVVGGTWAVSAPQAENYIYYQWSSNGISFENVARQTITFDGEGDVWVVLAIEDENQCVGVSDTCRFTIDAGEQKYSAVYPDGEENFTWCHGENSGHVEFDITSNQEIPDGITLKNELGWISNLSVDNYGTSAHFSFSYPYAQNQNFEVIDAQGNTLLTVNGYGNPYIKADITGDTLVVFTSGGDNSLELGTEILEFWNGSYYSANASYIDWTYDDTNISAECLGWKNDDEGTCSQNEMKFTFSETGVYPISFKASSNGCWSDEASKYIYVVPFNPALFSLSPEKDTIELGGNGVQLTLLYEGEPYQGDYALNTYGHVYITETGNIVKAVDQTGTFEVFAEVGGIRVATALITVNEQQIEYTVANVSVCEGTDEAEAAISASGSMYGRTITVQDEDGNVSYPEYNDDNDVATVHLNYLYVGTYTYKVYENDVYKTEFTVTVNSLPRASIECPTNPVVGDTWSPNTAMQEGISYHWYSDGISSLDGSMSCCPQVTFTEAGDFSATLVVKNNETGCLSEGATCEFTVGEKPIECDGQAIAFEYSASGNNYTYSRDGMAYSAVVGDEFTVTWEGTSSFTGYISLALVDKSAEAGYWTEVSDWNSIAVEAGVPFTNTYTFTINDNISSYPEIGVFAAVDDQVNSVFVCETNFTFTKKSDEFECDGYEFTFYGEDDVQLESLYEDVAVGNVFAYHVSGVADFTGNIVFSLEEVYDWFAIADEKMFSVVKGESFDFEGTFTVVNPEIDENMSFGMVMRREGVDPEDISYICLSDYSIERQFQSFAISESQFNMFVGTTKNIVLMADGEPYTRNYIEWNVIELSGSTNVCVSVEAGDVTALSEGQARIEAKVLDKVVATAIVTVREFNCNGELYSVTEDGVSYFMPEMNGTVSVGETYRVEMAGATDYDGYIVLVFGDFSSEKPIQGSTGGKIMVQAGEPFSYSTLLTTLETESQSPQYKLMVGLAGGSGTSRFCATKLEITKFEPQYAFDYTEYEMNAGAVRKLTLKNIDGSEYGGDAEWYSTDMTVATVQDGVVTALSDGFAEIQAYVGGNLVATTLVSVTESSGFYIGFDEPGYVFDNVGDERTICVNIAGSYEGYIHYEYDESIIKVIDSPYGESCKIVKALKPGRSYFVAYVTRNGERRQAGAAISVDDDNMLQFENREYEVSVGEELDVCLWVGDNFRDGFQPQFEFNEDFISYTPSGDSEYTCGVVKGLRAGQTLLVVSTYKNNMKYGDTVLVTINAEQGEDDYRLEFAQSKYEISEGESIRACLMIGDGFKHFDPQFSFDQTVISIANPTDDSDCGVVTGLKAGSTIINLSAVAPDGNTYSATTEVIVTAKQAPQMDVPVLTTETITLCYSKTAVSENMTSLDEYVGKASDNARLKWYDAAGNALISAPIIDPKTVGKRIYYVSQIASGYNESEKVALSVNIVYVAAPELNIYEQKVCDNTQTQAFVAKSQNNEIYWYKGEGNPIAPNTNTFMPSEAGTYLVRAIDVANGCVSDFATVNYAVGHTVRPQIEVEKTEYALDEKVVLAVQAVDEERYGVVWTIDGEVVQGTTATVVFAEEGNYKIPCTIVEKESGCFASDTVEISVKNTNIPVTAITVDPSAIELYEGEQSYLALSFTPAFATDRNYNIEVADTSVADVVGLTVFGLKEGVTTATISSTSNTSATASITITVKKFVAAREISLPTVITMAPEETKTITASVLPTNASYNEVFFTEKEDNVIRLSANGELTALAEGTSIITAYTKGGLKASSVVVVTASVAAITDIQVPERIEMKVGDSVSVSYKVVPATSLISQLNWAIGDEEMISFANGVVKAEKAGSTTLTVSFASIEKTIAIVVNESDAPVVITTPNVSATQGTDVKVTLSDVISDDNTAIEDLTVTTTSDKFNVTVENGVLTVIPKDNSFVGVDTVTVVVTDENNLSVELPVVVEITEIQNQAPEILMDTIMIKYNACNYIQLSELVSDDFTPYNKMKYSFTSNVKASVMLRKQLRLFTDNPDLESDILTMTVTDAEGVSTTKEILLLLTALPNKAPKIAEIPTQNENDESKFGTIDLAQYVKDDYTSSSAIAWSAADAENLAVTISDGKATVKVLNEFWNGAAAVTFYAKDEEGLTDSTVVYYVRNVTIKKEDPSQEPTTEVVATWEGAPSFDFMTMKTIGVPGAQFILMASCSGYECTWSWDIPGAKGVDPTSLMQMITFDEPGTYDVTFTVQSPDGNFEKSITKENFLTVVGISERTPAICKGEAVVLTATEGLDSYYWSTGDVKNTTTDRPEETALYQVTMKKGMFTLIDTVTVKVSVPVSLMEDSVMCKGTTFDLEAQGEYVSYTWNTGESTKAIALPDVVASYSVMAVDDMQCVSVDTFNLTTVNELPVIDLALSFSR